MAFGGLTIPWRVLKEHVERAQAERKQRIEAFTAGGGFKLTGSPNQQEWLMDRVKKAMLQSPSFEALMFEIRNDSAHPVHLTLHRNDPEVFVDGYDSKLTPGLQGLDMDDLNRLPSDPPAAHPNAITQGEILAHLMAEARQGAQGSGDPVEYANAHKAGIDAQNAYRDDLGQKGHRRHHPNDGGYNLAGNWEMTYDSGHNEVWVKGDTPRSISAIHRANLGPLGGSFDADDLADDLGKVRDGGRTPR